MKKTTKEKYLHQLYLAVLDWCEDGGEQDVEVIERLFKFSDLLKKEVPYKKYIKERSTKREKELLLINENLREENMKLKNNLKEIKNTIKTIRSLT